MARNISSKRLLHAMATINNRIMITSYLLRIRVTHYAVLPIARRNVLRYKLGRDRMRRAMPLYKGNRDRRLHLGSITFFIVAIFITMEVMLNRVVASVSSDVNVFWERARARSGVPILYATLPFTWWNIQIYKILLLTCLAINITIEISRTFEIITILFLNYY